MGGTRSGRRRRIGVLTVLIAGLTYSNLSGQAGMVAAAGIGLHLTLLGGFGMIAAAVLDRFAE